MRIAMIGGTGLLGSAGAIELMKKGHQVRSISLDKIISDNNIPKEMELITGNYIDMSEDDFKSFFKDCEGFIFAAGVDERVQAKPGQSAYEMFKKYNIDPLDKMLSIAKQCGVKKVVILGSYFSYFAKQWKELELTKYHPYIRSRIVQEELALSYSKDGTMDVAVLELPYIFGTQKGRKPVWLFMAEMIKKNKSKNMLFPRGGTTMVTVRQVGQAIAGALENSKGGIVYPVGWYNMEWKEWLTIFSKGMNCKKNVITVPKFVYKLYAKKLARDFKKKNVETGLEMVQYVKVMTAETFIDKEIIEKKLGVTSDDIIGAINESARLCLDILDNKSAVIEMKAD